MDKRYAQVIVLFLFTSVLAGYALIDVSTKYEELTWIQDASRRLRRTDNIWYTCTMTLTAEAVSFTEQIEVRGNQLTGEWVAEYYTTDEDGTRRILKSFCDGRKRYDYVDWTGEWEEKPFSDITMPDFEVPYVLNYGEADIAEVEQRQEGTDTTVTIALTKEYLAGLISEHYDEAQALYEGYRRAETSPLSQGMLELGMERYERMRIENARQIYAADADKVLRSVEYDAAVCVPEVVTDDLGQTALGKEKTILFRHRIEIKGYNEQQILDAIEQCGSEVW